MHSKLRWSPIVYTQGEDGVLVHKQSFSEVVALRSISERCIRHFILYAYEINDLCLLNY